MSRAAGGGRATTGVSEDFVFGTLATDDLRLAQLRADRSGILHGNDIEPADPRPGEPVTIRVHLGPAIRADRVTAYVTTDGTDPAGERSEPANGEAVVLERTGVEWDTLIWGYRESWAGVVPGQPSGTLVRYRIEAWSELGGASEWASEIAGVVAGERPEGVSDADAALFDVPGPGPALWPVRRRGGYAYHVDDERIPDWLRDAVIYQVFVDRFATAGGRPFLRPATLGGFYGGTLRGVIERLDHVADLGATCLWLSPVFPSPSHHGYDATDYRSIEPRLGSEADLRELVDAAHGRGIRVILDFAVNHVSSGHPAFRTALADRDSPQARWFTFTRWPDQYLSFFGVLDHPQVDSDDPGARAYMIESARHWLDLGVDGFRCDYANGPSHAFWSAFRAATRAANADSITLGEVVETPALQATYRGRLDGCLDFVLLQGLRRFFGFGSIGSAEFDDFLKRHLAFFEKGLVMPSFLDNHDMNRFLWVVGGDTRRLRLAALCQFTLPHPPIVYYGTEVGLSQDRDVRYGDGSGHPEESRLPMPWGEDARADLLAFYRGLVAFRRERSALWRGERRTLAADVDTGLYACACETGGDVAVVVLNNGGAETTFRDALVDGLVVGLATDPGVTAGGDSVTLPPFAGAVLVPAAGAARV